MLIIVSFTGLVVLLFILGKIMLSIQFNKEVKTLFIQSKPLQGNFSYNQLTALPAPVQVYFKHILKDGQPFISYARFTHRGQFKTGFKKDWVDIKGEQYVTVENPGFIWKGVTALFTARDMFISDKGRLVVSLLSLVNIVNVKGKTYDQGELLRWLGESILYPTNLLPGDRVQWMAIDHQKAKLIFSYQHFSLAFIITFNEIGEIVEMETNRFMDEKNEETWIIKPANYKEINNILIPTKFEVLWRLTTGDFSYARFNLEKIEYNKSSMF